MRGKWMIIRTAALAAFLLAVLGAGAASAKDRVYFVSRMPDSGGHVSFVNLDGSGGGADLNTTGATVRGPFGVAIDAAAGRIYWPNFSANKISFANLDGTGGGHDLNTTGATVSEPIGIAVDPTAGRVYWANSLANKISYANTNGTGGGDLGTSTATVNQPFGVALDPTTGRIYWTNGAGNKISFANLDGSGGGDLTTPGATVSDPTGIAVDPVARKVYWANWAFGGGSLAFANLNGSGGANLVTTGATVSGPEGVALDVAAGRIYWGNAQGNAISSAKLDNTGGGQDLSMAGASADWSVFPAILRAPLNTAAPTITGTPALGGTLGCTPGSWAGDLFSEVYYRAPRTISYQWVRDGAAVPGANSSSITTGTAGTYQCTVTASNAAGSTSLTTGGSTVFGDSDHDGILDPNDKCPTVPAGKFDFDHNGCPGPYPRIKLSTLGTWSIFPKGVQIGSMTVRGLHKGVKVKLSCRACHVSQTLTAKRSTLSLKKLKRKLIRRGKSFTLTATAFGFIGDQLTLTVKRYGRKHADLVRAARNPFTKKHRCLPVGSSKTAKTCSATPPTGP